ncbi:MAG: oligosaccharide flippase family protein [Anaerotruncus sp.]|nr:oligosaccharide flippase family protein [Anaerotruncus sp.]
MPELEALALKNKAIRGASVNIAAQSVAIACQTVGAVILARLLGPTDFGLVAIVTAFSTWIANFGVNGFTEYIIYRPDLSKDEVVSIYWLHVLIASVLTAGFVGFGFALVGIYRQPRLSGIAAAMAASFVLRSVDNPHRPSEAGDEIRQGRHGRAERRGPELHPGDRWGPRGLRLLVHRRPAAHHPGRPRPVRVDPEPLAAQGTHPAQEGLPEPEIRGQGLRQPGARLPVQRLGQGPAREIPRGQPGGQLRPRLQHLLHAGRSAPDAPPQRRPGGPQPSPERQGQVHGVLRQGGLAGDLSRSPGLGPPDDPGPRPGRVAPGPELGRGRLRGPGPGAGDRGPAPLRVQLVAPPVPGNAGPLAALELRGGRGHGHPVRPRGAARRRRHGRGA